MTRLSVLFLVLLMVGCGPKPRSVATGTVTGSVTLDGKPVSSASIAFLGESNGDAAIAEIGADGTYSLKYETGFSVPVGDYRVVVTPSTSALAAPNPADMMKTVTKPVIAKNTAIPEKYRDPKNSGLIAVVKEGANPNTNFELKSK